MTAPAAAVGTGWLRWLATAELTAVEQKPDITLEAGSRRGRFGVVAESRDVITAAEMDKMTPQQRADAVDAGSVRDWCQVEPDFRKRVEARARQLAHQRSADT